MYCSKSCSANVNVSFAISISLCAWFPATAKASLASIKAASAFCILISWSIKVSSSVLASNSTSLSPFLTCVPSGRRLMIDVLPSSSFLMIIRSLGFIVPDSSTLMVRGPRFATKVTRSLPACSLPLTTLSHNTIMQIRATITIAPITLGDLRPLRPFFTLLFDMINYLRRKFSP